MNSKKLDDINLFYNEIINKLDTYNLDDLEYFLEKLEDYFEKRIDNDFQKTKNKDFSKEINQLINN